MKLDGDAMWRIDSGWEMRSEVEEQRLRGFFPPLAICVLKPPFHLSAWSEICMQTCMFSFPYKILQCIPHPAFLHSLNLPSLLTSTATICTIKAAARGNQYSKDEANIKNRYTMSSELIVRPQSCQSRTRRSHLLEFCSACARNKHGKQQQGSEQQQEI